MNTQSERAIRSRATRRVSTETNALPRKRKLDSNDQEQTKKLCIENRTGTVGIDSANYGGGDGKRFSVVSPSPVHATDKPALVPFESFEMSYDEAKAQFVDKPVLIPTPRVAEYPDYKAGDEPKLDGHHDAASILAKNEYEYAQKSSVTQISDSLSNRYHQSKFVVNSWRSIVWALVAGGVAFAMAFKTQTVSWKRLGLPNFLKRGSPVFRAKSAEKVKETICVPGGGFSGFWFTYGQLQSMKGAKPTQNFYCFSSGCLGMVGVLANLQVEKLLDVALEAQRQWRIGQISRFEVVPQFVDELIDLIITEKQKTSNPTSVVSNVSAVGLDSLRIITGKRNENGFGVKAVLHTPVVEDSTWVPSLRKLLIQTTWIPGAIGHDLWLDDHIDGLFVARQVWGECDHIVKADFGWDLFWNSLNVQIRGEQALSFWKAGLERGL